MYSSMIHGEHLKQNYTFTRDNVIQQSFSQALTNTRLAIYCQLRFSWATKNKLDHATNVCNLENVIFLYSLTSNLPFTNIKWGK